MRRIEPGEVLGLAAYEAVRETQRAELIALKRRRRVTLGPQLSLLFENRATVLFQIQEMLRAEQRSGAAAVRDEIEAYDRLLPGPGELSGTLFVEIDGVAGLLPRQARQALERFRNLDRDAVFLRVGEQRLPARFDADQQAGERVAAVRSLRFRVPETVRAALADARCALALRVDHAACRIEQPLSAETRAELLSDLADV